MKNCLLAWVYVTLDHAAPILIAHLGYLLLVHRLVDSFGPISFIFALFVATMLQASSDNDV